MCQTPPEAVRSQPSEVIPVNSRLSENALALAGGHAVPNPLHHADSRVRSELGAVPRKKIPVERVERAGVFSVLLPGVVGAGAAIVAHLASVHIFP